MQLLELLDSTGKLKEQESAITAERDSAEAQAKTVNEALSAARIEQSTARSSAEEIAARMSTVDEVIASRGGLLDALREQAEVSRKNLDACLENIESLSNSIDGYSMIVRSRAEKAEKLRRELDAATLDIHQKQARIRMLEDLEKNMEGYSGSVKAGNAARYPRPRVPADNRRCEIRRGGRDGSRSRRAEHSHRRRGGRKACHSLP